MSDKAEAVYKRVVCADASLSVDDVLAKSKEILKTHDQPQQNIPPQTDDLEALQKQALLLFIERLEYLRACGQ